MLNVKAFERENEMFSENEMFPENEMFSEKTFSYLIYNLSARNLLVWIMNSMCLDLNKKKKFMITINDKLFHEFRIEQEEFLYKKSTNC